MKFHVGQRVRIVLSENPELQYLVGPEATIDYIGITRFGSPYSLKTDLPLRVGKALGAWDRHIEPIGPSNQLVSWHDCLWRPKKEKA